VVAFVAAAAAAQAGCGGSGAGGTSTPAGGGVSQPSTRSAGEVTTTGPDQTGDDGNSTTGSGADPYSEGAGDSEAALVQSVRAYVSAIDRGDGQAVCKLFVPGALRGVQLPRPGGGCADAVGASIGSHPAGEAAWQGTEIRRIGPVELDRQSPGGARVRATVVHRYNRHREPSIEDDLVYLSYRGGHWLVAKPSSTFYRAIGARNVPLSALVPP
jgi:hypothetical protein